MSTISPSPTIADAVATAVAVNAAIKAGRPNRGSNKQPRRQRYVGRSTRARKTFIESVNLYLGGRMNSEQRGICASLCAPLDRTSRY